VRFIRMTSHTSLTTPSEHLDTFYEPLDEIYDERFDGLIITGAPVETLAFEEVDYWPELVHLMDWAKSHVWSTLFICWGAQAGLYHYYGIGKRPLPQKMFGLFWHHALDLKEPLLRGFDEVFLAPHSRHTEVCAEEIAAVPELTLLATSEEAGVYLAASRNGRRVFVTGHPEYDKFTLKAEYERDLAKGLPIALPVNYFPNNDPTQEPVMTWRAHAHLLYANWLNYCVYQETPYDLNTLGGSNV